MIPDEAPAGGINFSDIAVMVQGGYGAVFGVKVQTIWLIRVSRYNADRKQVSCHLVVILLTALVQCRGTKHGRNQKFVKVQRFYLGVAAGVKAERYEDHDIESRMFKNRDKQMTFIVRVRASLFKIFPKIWY